VGRSTRILVAALGVTAFAAGACSASKSATPASSQTPSSAQTSQAPEDKRASAAEVATGLRKIDDTAKGVASKAAGDKAGAQALDSQIEPVWQTIEGTVKASSPDGYAAFEDSFGLLESAANAGDAVKAGTASTAVSKAVADYLAKYPAS
jgi:hypothetical protein